MSRQDALLLDASLASGDVSQAWSVWSSAVESALADAYRFSGGPLPSTGLVLGRGVVLLLGLLSLVVIRFARLVAMLLMSFYIVTLLLLPCLICGGDLRL